MRLKSLQEMLKTVRMVIYNFSGVAQYYNDVMMRATASQITSVSMVYLTVSLGEDHDQRNIKVPRHWPLCRELTGNR